MPEDRGAAIDPWRIAVDLTRDATASAAEHPELQALLARHARRFGAHTSSTAAVLDEVQARSVLDIDAPVASSRPIVPAVKRAVRKANAFLARHLASQMTVLVGGLAVAARQLDDRLARLEREHDTDRAATLAPDVTEPVRDVLEALPSAGAARVVRTLAEARTLPAGDAALVVVVQVGDVAGPGARSELLEHVAAGVAPGGQLAIVGTTPAAWPTMASVLARDLAPGRPIHPETWIHLLEERDAREVEVHQAADAYVVVAGW